MIALVLHGHGLVQAVMTELDVLECFLALQANPRGKCF